MRSGRAHTRPDPLGVPTAPPHRPEPATILRASGGEITHRGASPQDRTTPVCLEGTSSWQPWIG
jgi:hypothetical protein